MSTCDNHLPDLPGGPDFARLERARAAQQNATPGKWGWNCAGEVFATVDGAEVCIGNFNGCEADAAAVCRLHNNAAQLFALAGVCE